MTDSTLPCIVGLDASNWFGQWMNRQQLLSRLAARGWPVVYANGPLSVWNRDSANWRDAPYRWRTRHDAGVRVLCPSRIPPSWPTHPVYESLALGLYARRLRAACPRPGRDIIGLAFEPAFNRCLRALRPRWTAFHVRDAYDHMPDWTAADAANSKDLQERADLVTISSPELRDSLIPAVRNRARTLLNGADVRAFSAGLARRCPADLAPIPHPRLGYVGGLSKKMDFELIHAIATREPGWHWVFVGPVTGVRPTQRRAPDPAHDAWNACLSQPNVHWLGQKRVDELPAYTAHFDVNTMPYLTDESAGLWARYAYPLKLHESLAVGKPVVSAFMPALTQHEDVLAMVRGADAWHAALAHAISEGGVGTPARRQAVAMANTWDHRVDDLDRWLREMVSGRCEDSPKR